jgi:hypothetical protein
MEGVDLLSIQPGQLEYVFASNVELKATLSLKNILTDGRSVAYKIKTSAVNRLDAHLSLPMCAAFAVDADREKPPSICLADTARSTQIYGPAHDWCRTKHLLSERENIHGAPVPVYR